MHVSSTLLTMFVVLTGQPTGDFGEISGSQSTTLTHCVVTLIDEVQVPAEDAGVLMSLNVREGDVVKSGEIIARLDPSEAEAEYNIAQFQYKIALEQAENDIRLRVAQADAEIVETEYLEADDLSAGPNSDAAQKRLRRLLLAPRRAHLQTEAAKLDFRIAKLNSQTREAQLAVAENKVRRRQIESPLDGVVVRVYRHGGEWVSPGEAIVHVVRMDRLRVEGFVSAADFAPREVVGRPVTITVHLTRGRTERMTSKIAFASPLVETNGQYRVFAEVDNVRLENHWLIRPGLTADMLIDVSPPKSN